MVSTSEIKRLGERLHALTHVFEPPLGSGSGPSFVIKDLIDVAGISTGGGGVVPVDPSPAANAACVDRLLEAGWQAVAKTHTVELAYGGWGTNRAVGAPWNPWDSQVHRIPGGSSSGSAVCVAAGLCDLGLGTDTGGSIRMPASACGIVGLKPGRGLVSLTGVHDLAPSLDTVGTLARTVAMAAEGLEIIARGGGRTSFSAAAAMALDTRGWPVAALSLESLGDLEPDVSKAYVEAIDRLKGSGVDVRFVTPPRPLEDYFAPNGILISGEGWRIRGAHIEANRAVMDPWVVKRFEIGRGISDADLVAAQARRQSDQAEFHAWLGNFKAMFSPTTPMGAPPIEEVEEQASAFSRFTRAANYLDLPAASLPCGLSAQAMPMGFQIMANPADETAMVALAATFERVSGWNGRVPDLSGFAA